MAHSAGVKIKISLLYSPIQQHVFPKPHTIVCGFFLFDTDLEVAFHFVNIRHALLKSLPVFYIISIQLSIENPKKFWHPYLLQFNFSLA